MSLTSASIAETEGLRLTVNTGSSKQGVSDALCAHHEVEGASCLRRPDRARADRDETVEFGSVGGLRSKSGGRAQRPAGAAGRLGADLPTSFATVSLTSIDELLPGARAEEEIVGPGRVLAQLAERL